MRGEVEASSASAIPLPLSFLMLSQHFMDFFPSFSFSQVRLLVLAAGEVVEFLLRYAIATLPAISPIPNPPSSPYSLTAPAWQSLNQSRIA